MRTDIARAAARYMLQHNWLKDGVAEDQVAAIIDREMVAHPSKALRALAEKVIDLRCPDCGCTRFRTEISI